MEKRRAASRHDGAAAAPPRARGTSGDGTVLGERFMLTLALSVVDIAERVMALLLRLREGSRAATKRTSAHEITSAQRHGAKDSPGAEGRI